MVENQRKIISVPLAFAVLVKGGGFRHFDGHAVVLSKLKNDYGLSEHDALVVISRLKDGDWAFRGRKR